MQVGQGSCKTLDSFQRLWPDYGVRDERQSGIFGLIFKFGLDFNFLFLVFNFFVILFSFFLRLSIMSVST